jgi:hypothetical protein
MHKVLLFSLLFFGFTSLQAQSNDSTGFHGTVCIRNWCNGSTIQNLHLDVVASTNTLPNFNFNYPQADPITGCFVFDSLPLGPGVPNDAKILFIPSKDNAQTNGVDVLDLLLISKHILGLAPLPPYGNIAADVNRSNSISTFDLVELGKLILGIYTELPNNTSWNFINTDTTVAASGPPFQVEMIGIKTGDVNCSASNSNAPTLPAQTITIFDEYVQAGDKFKIPLYFGKSPSFIGFQYGLKLDPAYLSILNLQGQFLPNMSAGNFGIFQGLINSIWYDLTATKVPEGQSFTTITVKALKSGWLHDMIQLNTGPNAIPALAYDSQENKALFKLEFLKKGQANQPKSGVNAPGSSAKGSACLNIQNCSSSTVEFCDFTPNNSALWNENAWTSALYNSQDLPEGIVDLGIAVENTCGAPVHIRYELYLDLNNDGFQETLVNSDSLPGFNQIKYNNLGGSGISVGFDERSVGFNQQYGFAQKNSVTGNISRAYLRWNTALTPKGYVLPQLPQGLHKIRWVVTDTLQNEAICTYPFEVKDCKKPNVVCLNGISVNLMPTKQIELWASDFLQYAEDNSTPNDLLSFGIRKANGATGFPLDSNGLAQQSIRYNCSELGTQIVQLWAKDKAGNADFCETLVQVQDNNGNCPPENTVKLNVCFKNWCNQAPMADVDVTLHGSGNGIPGFTFNNLTDQNGCANLSSFPFAANSYITASYDDNPLNGSSLQLYDLIQIAKHIQGIDTLPAYAQIAADANKSNSVTSFDIDELRKVLLHVYEALPNNTHWRFIDAAFQFPNKNNPFQTSFPESLSLAGISSDSIQDYNFVGVKVGDVDCTSSIYNFDSTHVEVLNVRDEYVQEGDQFKIPLFFGKTAQWLGFQYALKIDPILLSVLNVEPKLLPNFNNNAFGFSSGNLRCAWVNATPFTIPAGAVFTSITVKALESGWLHDAISLEPLYFNQIGYKGNEKAQRLTLQFIKNQQIQSAEVPANFSAQPNPTSGAAWLPIQLEEAATIQIELQDMHGQTRWSQKMQLDAGEQNLEIPAHAFGQPGVYTWRFWVGEVLYQGKIVRS